MFRLAFFWGLVWSLSTFAAVDVSWNKIASTSLNYFSEPLYLKNGSQVFTGTRAFNKGSEIIFLNDDYKVVTQQVVRSYIDPVGRPLVLGNHVFVVDASQNVYVFDLAGKLARQFNLEKKGWSASGRHFFTFKKDKFILLLSKYDSDIRYLKLVIFDTKGKFSGEFDFQGDRPHFTFNEDRIYISAWGSGNYATGYYVLNAKAELLSKNGDEELCYMHPFFHPSGPFSSCESTIRFFGAGAKPVRSFRTEVTKLPTSNLVLEDGSILVAGYDGYHTRYSPEGVALASARIGGLLFSSGARRVLPNTFLSVFRDMEFKNIFLVSFDKELKTLGTFSYPRVRDMDSGVSPTRDESPSHFAYATGGFQGAGRVRIFDRNLKLQYSNLKAPVRRMLPHPKGGWIGFSSGGSVYKIDLEG